MYKYIYIYIVAARVSESKYLLSWSSIKNISARISHREKCCSKNNLFKLVLEILVIWKLFPRYSDAYYRPNMSGNASIIEDCHYYGLKMLFFRRYFSQRKIILYTCSWSHFFFITIEIFFKDQFLNAISRENKTNKQVIFYFADRT